MNNRVIFHRFILPVLLIPALFAGSSIVQANPQWLELATSDNGTKMFFEQGTAKTDGTRIQFRFKVAYPKASVDSTRYEKPVKEVIAVKTADCNAKMIAANETTFMYLDGTSKKVPGNGQLVQMDPKSNLTKLYELICQAPKNAPKTVN